LLTEHTKCEDKTNNQTDMSGKLKAHMIQLEEKLLEKEEELEKYEHLASKMLETEQQIDKIISEKDQREEELLQKMSGIADHYHKEKEKNQKLMAELQR